MLYTQSVSKIDLRSQEPSRGLGSIFETLWVYPFPLCKWSFATPLILWLLFLGAHDTGYCENTSYPKQFEGHFQDWEHKPLELISLFLPKQPVILEAGAHYGKETLDFVRIWPEAKILTFEPNPHAFAILCSQTAAFENIHTFNLALSNASGPARFYICYGTYGNNPIFEHASSLLAPNPKMQIHYQGPEITVNCVRADEWSRQSNINSIDLLRLDMGGMELQILKDAPEILSQVKCIYTKTYDYPFRIGTPSYLELRQFLETSGFRLLAHWHQMSLEGTAIFIRNDFFDPYSAEDISRKQDAICAGNYTAYFCDGAYFYIDDIPDSIKSLLKQGRAWEGNQARCMQALTKEGSIAIDVGAHIGVHTMHLSKAVGPRGAVIAFEPQEKIYTEHLLNLKHNNCTNVISLCKALGESFSTTQLTPRDPTNEGGTAIGKGGEAVEVIPLDCLNLSNVSFIKMDVENYELSVLKGANETIKRNKPAIFLEINGSNLETNKDRLKENFIQVISLLESYDYEVFRYFGKDYVAIPRKSTRDLSAIRGNLKRIAKETDEDY